MNQENKKQSPVVKILIVAVLVIAVGAAIYAKNASRPNSSLESGAKTDGSPKEAVDATESTGEAIPKLVDLGSKSCIPCKMMAPILDELEEEYKGKFDVVFIDVWENKAAAESYGVRTIPTQIFYDAEGAEKFRHEGFFSKEDILAKWKQLGVSFGETSALPEIERWETAQTDNRSKDQICYMCDKDIVHENL